MLLPDLQQKVNTCLKVLQTYKWMLDLYVLDFYVDNHWSLLPVCLRECLDTVPPQMLSELLAEGNFANSTQVWPLQLLALKQTLQFLNISRKCTFVPAHAQHTIMQHAKLKYFFSKSVKCKKRHELERMAAICKLSCDKTAVDFVVDFGAGLGHLARILGYAHGIRVCCLEMQSQLNAQARKIDEELEILAAKHLTALERAHFQRPTHINLCLTADMTPANFITTIKTALNLPLSVDIKCGIIGLHSCGDLGAILMRLFLNCKEAQFLHFVGCCYMKLSHHGFPLSSQLIKQTNLCDLSWVAREISCHASETYYDRLSIGDYEYLKVHSFRAATERILVQHWPHLKHTGLKSVKHTPGMLFETYFYTAVKHIPEAMKLNIDDLSSNDLKYWKRIVILYTLRLMLAPLVESVILYDRFLYLQERQCTVNIEAIFDPRLSPRNHITSAIKKINK